MYRRRRKTQGEFESFHLAFGGRLSSENRWVKMAKLIPWDEIEGPYAEQLSEDRGAPAINARVAFGSLIIKEKLGLTDEETVEQIRENPYLQYFLGYEAYRYEAPFDPSMMVHFRRRFTEAQIVAMNERVVDLGTNKKPSDEKDDDEQNDASGGKSKNSGQLKIDASCTPADIRYPTDLSTLNEVREKSERIIDILHEPDVGKKVKPRTYRRRARKEYLAVAKQRRPTGKTIRKACGKQLRYIARNLRTIKELDEDRLHLLSGIWYRILLVAHEVYRQQKQMYDQRSHSVPDRIVSVSQPHVRPIVRGKAGRPTEFGAKISVSKIGRFVYLDRLSWDAYNESGDLKPVVEAYHMRFGCYPESVHVDKIYRNRENRGHCKERGIRMSGPRLGRPKLNPPPQERRQALEDERRRNEVEGALGRSKRRFSLSRVPAKCADTSETAIAIVFLVMNLETLVRFFLCLCGELLFAILLMPRRKDLRSGDMSWTPL
jgi:hypothetical protein